MTGPLIVVDSDRKGKVFLDAFSHEAEVVTVLSPPFSCSYTEDIDEEGKSQLRFSFSPLPNHLQFIETLDSDSDRELLLAFDNDVIGDYLSWLILGYVQHQKGSLGKVKRLPVSRYSKGELQKVLEKTMPADLEERQDFYIRSLFDSGLGAHLQRLIGSRVGPGNRPLTYASLTLLFLLADRETEIKMFTPNKRWQIMVEFGVNDKKFTARLEQAPNLAKDGLVRDVNQGKELVDRIQESIFVIDEIERSELFLGTPSPYVLVELLHDAQVLYGFQPGKTVAILKNISAGVEVQGKWQALVYSLLDSEDDCADLLTALKKTAGVLFGEENRRETPQELSPGMLLPLEPDIDSGSLGEALDEDSLKIYGMVRGRALASQMKDAVGEIIKVRLQEGDNVLHAHFNSITQKGFLSAYQGRHGDDLMEPCPFVDLKEGQQLESMAVVPEQAVGSSAEHYTYETLFAELADFSVSPAPHNLMMLQGLIDHGYIVVSPDGSLLAGSNTERVAKLLSRAFPGMIGINLSAYIEQTVNEVLSGRKGLDFALKQFSQTLMSQGKSLLKVKVPQKIALKKRSSSTIIKQRPKAATPAREKSSGLQSGEIEKEQTESSESAQKVVENLPDEVVTPSPEVDELTGQDVDVQETVSPESEVAAPPGLDLPGPEQTEGEESPVESLLSEDKEEWPDEEKGTLTGVDALPDTAEAGGPEAESVDSPGELVETEQSKTCQVCGKIMILKKDRFGKFWNCSGFPSCRHSESFSTEKGSALTCPLCKESEIVTKRTPTGKSFYVCLEPDCEFMAWSEPHPVQCQICESPYLVEKKSATGKKHLRCPRAGCNYMQAFPGEDGADLLGEKAETVEPAKPARKKVRVVRRAKGASGSGGGTKKVRRVRRRK